MRPFLSAIVVSVALSACASAPTLYQPALRPQAVGYSEFQIEAGRYRINFRGGPGAPPEQVSDYALLRAADLAIAGGYDWFRVVERDMRQTSEGSASRMSVGVGGGDFGYRGGVGVGMGTTIPLGGGPSLTATMEVLMGKGPKPAAPEVYDARDVRKVVGART